MKWNEYTWNSRWGAIILFLIILPILSFYIGRQYEQSTTINTYIQPITTQDNSPHFQSGTSSVDTNISNWKSFIDEKYGFEFKYPPIFGNMTTNLSEYITKLDCNPGSDYTRVITNKNIEGLNVEISCSHDFERNAPTYARDVYGGQGTYNVITNKEGKKSYFFDYVSGVGYTNQELYIPISNGLYVSLFRSQKNGWPQEYPPLTVEQAKMVVSTFKEI
jgi:hypothetical protein